MRSILLLLKIQFRSRLNLKDLTTVRSGGTSGKWKRAAVLALFAVLAAYLVGIYTVFLNFLFNAAIDFGFPELVMHMVVLLTMAMTAVFGIFVTMSGIFLSRDTELLSSLPIRSQHVFLAKFLFVYLCELMLSAVFLLPAITLYAIKVEGAMGIGIFLRGIYITLLSPMLPLVVSTVLVSLLMWVIGKLRRRDLFITIGTFALLIGVTLGQFYLQSKMMSAPTGGDFLTEFFHANWTTMNAFAKPPISWASFAIHAGGMNSALNLILFTLVSIFAYAIVRLVCGGIYRHAVSVNLETAKKSRSARRRALTDKARSPKAAFFRKELRVFFRTPVYLTNGLAGIVFPLMVLLLPTLSGDTAVLRSLGGAVPAPVMALILGGLAILFSGFNSGAATVLSREGRTFEHLRSLPLEPRDAALAKLLFGIGLCPLWTLPLCVFAIPTLGIDIGTALLGFVFGMVGGILLSAICVWIDLARPKLHWDTETEAIKQNFNVMLAMLVGLAVTVGIGIGVYLLLAHTAIPAWAILIATTALFASAALFVAQAAIKSGEKTFASAE